MTILEKKILGGNEVSQERHSSLMRKCIELRHDIRNLDIADFTNRWGVFDSEEYDRISVLLQFQLAITKEQCTIIENELKLFNIEIVSRLAP